MELKQKQGRDERTQENYPTSAVYFCRCPVVFLPGAGWTLTRTARVRVSLPGYGEPPMQLLGSARAVRAPVVLTGIVRVAIAEKVVLKNPRLLQRRVQGCEDRVRETQLQKGEFDACSALNFYIRVLKIMCPMFWSRYCISCWTTVYVQIFQTRNFCGFREL